jgi:hypothetical protein
MVVLIPLPPQSPEHALWDFLLFPGTNQDLKIRRFADVTEVQQKSLTAIEAIP